MFEYLKKNLLQSEFTKLYPLYPITLSNYMKTYNYRDSLDYP